MLWFERLRIDICVGVQEMLVPIMRRLKLFRGGLNLALILLVIGMMGLMWGDFVHSTQRTRQSLLHQAVHDTTNLAVAFREHIGRTLTALDQIMLAVKYDHMTHSGRFEIPEWLHNSSFLSGMAVQITLVDSTGIARVSNLGLSPTPLDLSDRPHIRHHFDARATQPYISAPVLGRVSGKWSIQVTRRLERADGAFAGVIVISLDPSYLSQMFDTVNLGANGVVTLVGRDGIIRARRNAATSNIGQDLRAGTVFAELAKSDHGTYTATSLIDNVKRIFSYTAVPGFPLVVIVGKSRDDVLSDFDDAFGNKVLATAIISALLVLLLGFLIREVERRRRRERAHVEQAMLLTNILDLTPAAILVKDATGKITIANDAAARLFARPKLDVVGRHLTELLPADGAREIAEWDGEARASPGKLVVGERAFVVDGQHQVLICHRRACELESGPIVISAWSDITAVRQAEMASRRANEAEVANRVKSEFLANMSHELRTPLNAVIGFSEIMKSEMLGPLGNDNYREYCADIHNAGNHLLSIVNDILDLTKAEAGQLVVRSEDVDAVDSIEAVRRMTSPEAERRGLVISFNGPAALPCYCDENRLRQVLLNLVSNALKFTPAGGSVRISTRNEDGQVVIEVSDSGIGMSPSDILIALAPFGQVDSSLSRKNGGTGLGLPLAKTHVELMGGTFDLISEPNKGTTVTIKLPGHKRTVPQRDNADLERATASD